MKRFLYLLGYLGMIACQSQSGHNSNAETQEIIRLDSGLWNDSLKLAISIRDSCVAEVYYLKDCISCDKVLGYEWNNICSYFAAVSQNAVIEDGNSIFLDINATRELSQSLMNHMQIPMKVNGTDSRVVVRFICGDDSNYLHVTLHPNGFVLSDYFYLVENDSLNRDLFEKVKELKVLCKENGP